VDDELDEIVEVEDKLEEEEVAVVRDVEKLLVEVEDKLEIDEEVVVEFDENVVEDVVVVEFEE
jgi:hypothetical protein